jgi:hypothetical protein
LRVPRRDSPSSGWLETTLAYHGLPEQLIALGTLTMPLATKKQRIGPWKPLTPLTGESLDIIGSLDHLRLDLSKGGNMRPGSPRPIFTKTMEASGPVQGPLFGIPYQDREVDYSRFDPRMTCDLVDRGPFFSLGGLEGTLTDTVERAAVSASSQLELPRQESPSGQDPAWGSRGPPHRETNVASMANREAVIGRLANAHQNISCPASPDLRHGRTAMVPSDIPECCNYRSTPKLTP